MLCGTGRRVINPAPGHHLAGYGPDYPNTGVHDDITVTALFLSDGRRAVLLAYDLIGILAPLNLRIRTAVSDALSVPLDRVVLTTTHVHSGPEVRDYSLEMGPKNTCRADYSDRLVEWSVEAAREAAAGAEPCLPLYNSTQADENMNRRFQFPDRRALYVPNYKQLAGLSDQFVDRELGLLAFRKEGTPNQYKALLTNYAAHPLCVGNSSNLVTADYQGALRRTVEETFSGCTCIATTGAAGDQHPRLPESGFVNAQRMGATLGTLAITRAYDAVSAGYDQKLRICWRDISIKLKDTPTRLMLPTQAARDHLPHAVRQGARDIRTSFALLGIGPILLAAVPGELVAELGAMIKWSSPFPKTFVLFQSTDAIGYIPARNQYLWGNYEANDSPLAAGEGERFVQAIVSAACDLVQQDPLNLPPVE